MKYFKCGNCTRPYKIDASKVSSSALLLKCTNCGASNVLRFGPVLVAQTKAGVLQFPLRTGSNTVGRKAPTGSATIQIEDAHVSREHADIHLEEKEGKVFAFMTDKGSLNGTYNKNKARLKPGLKYPITTSDYYIVGLTKLSIKFQ
jgi:predicted Zn finger-like uncharacterized protein